MEEQKTKRATFIVDVDLIEKVRKYSYYTGIEIKDIVNEALRDYFEKYQENFTKAVEEDLKKLKKEGK